MQRSPGERGGVALGEHLKPMVAHPDAVTIHRDGVAEVAEHRIVLQQMGQRAGVGDVVHRHDLDLALALRRPHDVPADAAEPVDSHSCCHVFS